MMAHWFPVALLMACLSLDETALGQFMVSRPIVTGPLVGWLLGRADLGVEIGALAELIWIGDVPIGAHLPLDLMMLTGTSVALACELAQGQNPEAVMTYAIGIAIPLAALSTEAEIILRKFHIRWLHFAQRMAFNGQFGVFEWVNSLVLVEQWVKGFVLSVVCLTIAHFSASLYYLLGNILDGRVLEGFYYAHWLLLALGCSAVIDLMVQKKTAVVLLLSITAMMFLALWPLPGMVLVAVSLVAGFIMTLMYMERGEAA